MNSLNNLTPGLVVEKIDWSTGLGNCTQCIQRFIADLIEVRCRCKKGREIKFRAILISVHMFAFLVAVEPWHNDDDFCVEKQLGYSDINCVGCGQAFVDDETSADLAT